MHLLQINIKLKTDNRSMFALILYFSPDFEKCLVTLRALLQNSKSEKAIFFISMQIVIDICRIRVNKMPFYTQYSRTVLKLLSENQTITRMP